MMLAVSDQLQVTVDPFLKSAGGKRQLLSKILPLVPQKFGTYFEPFVGGGALFFALRPSKAVLGDANAWFIAAYKGVRNDGEGVIRALRKMPYEKSFYLRQRALVKGTPVYDTATAARVIYLNKTCFNGLWRVNKSGGFNVPLGAYTNPTICDAVGLRECSEVLKAASLSPRGFEVNVKAAERGDFVYMDPPYDPVSETSSFSQYTAGGFNREEQMRLRDCALGLKRRGVKVLLSNADSPYIRALYRDGFEIIRVEASRSINSKGSGRGNVGELLIR